MLGEGGELMANHSQKEFTKDIVVALELVAEMTDTCGTSSAYTENHRQFILAIAQELKKVLRGKIPKKISRCRVGERCGYWHYGSVYKCPYRNDRPYWLSRRDEVIKRLLQELDHKEGTVVF